MLSRIILIIAVFVLVEVYCFFAVKRLFKSKKVIAIYVVSSLLIILYFISTFLGFDRETGQNQHSLLVFAFLLLYLLTKATVSIFLLVEDFYRLFAGVYNYFYRKNQLKKIPTRRRAVSRIAVLVAFIPFFSILYGIFQGKYNFKVVEQTVYFEDLPDSFDGFKILQISDIHCGSFDNNEKIDKAIDLINRQNFDVFVFTGDLVNNFAWEMHPWIETFQKIKNPKYGKFSVLGNHDYGEYAIWKSEKAKQKNFEEIKDLHRQIGFRLLLNENAILQKDSDSLVIVGVENWGETLRFQRLGDLDKAAENLKAEDFKVLLSHDPSHFDVKVRKHPKNFQLTLSGHTHGLQFGVEIPDIFKWSPIQYIYKHWAGLYEDSGKHLYVNRGFGFHAYSGRVGIWPEITVIQLKKAQKR